MPLNGICGLLKPKAATVPSAVAKSVAQIPMKKLFLVLMFTSRFFIEFLKMGQASRDSEALLNTGQILSIPFIIVGLYFTFRKIGALKKGYPF